MKKGHMKIAIAGLYLSVFLILIAFTLFGNKAISVISEKAVTDNGKCIIIDAGHGDPDGGATSCTGITESSLNLEISLRLADLMQLLGMQTKQIRNTDTSVYTTGNTIASKKISDLKNRVAIINDTENAIVISIHQNYYPDHRYSGAQVFYAPSANSSQFAKQLQASLVQNLDPGNNRQAKSADGIYLMQHIQRPGILIECGFLSNPSEEAKIRSASYQKKLCCVIAAETLAYIDYNSAA